MRVIRNCNPGQSSAIWINASTPLARKIEAARPSANVVFYGYVESVQRRRLYGADQKERFVMIHMQKLEIRDGKTNEVLVSTPI